MAGAMSTGERVASSSEVRKSSAMPWAARAMVLAVAGATRTSAASVASAMCSMSALAPGVHWLVMTGRWVMASKVSGATKRRGRGWWRFAIATHRLRLSAYDV